MTSIGILHVGTPVRAIRSVRVDRDEMSVNGKLYFNGEWINDVLDYGHVVRFDRNVTGEVIVVVDWSFGDRCSIHPSNLEMA